MARLGSKVDTVTDKQSGVSVDIYLDKKTLKFGAEFADFQVIDKDGDKVRNDILRAIRERAEMTWVPVIRAEQSYSPGIKMVNGLVQIVEQREVMGLEIERFYAARKFDGSWVRAPWEMEPDQRMRNATRFYELRNGAPEIKYLAQVQEDALHRNNMKGIFLLQFDEDLWNGLLEVIHQMRRIRALVVELLSDEEGVQRLIAVGSGTPLLGKGE